MCAFARKVAEQQVINYITYIFVQHILIGTALFQFRHDQAFTHHTWFIDRISLVLNTLAY